MMMEILFWMNKHQNGKNQNQVSIKTKIVKKLNQININNNVLKNLFQDFYLPVTQSLLQLDDKKMEMSN
jgi:hypothetical protein